MCKNVITKSRIKEINKENKNSKKIYGTMDQQFSRKHNSSLFCITNKQILPVFPLIKKQLFYDLKNG